MHQNHFFSSPQEVQSALREQQYIASDEIATIMYLSQQLGKPLLTEGPAGVGKTELAKTISGATGRELIRLQCYGSGRNQSALRMGVRQAVALYPAFARQTPGDLEWSQRLDCSCRPPGCRRGRLFLDALPSAASFAQSHSQRVADRLVNRRN